MPYITNSSFQSYAYLRTARYGSLRLRSVSITRNMEFRYEYGAGSHMPYTIRDTECSRGHGVATLDLYDSNVDINEIMENVRYHTREPFEIICREFTLRRCYVSNMHFRSNGIGNYELIIEFVFGNEQVRYYIRDSERYKEKKDMTPVAERILVRVMRGLA